MIQRIPSRILLLTACFLWQITLVAQTPAEINTRPMISAHRGASRVAPENTWAAFSAAIEQGADYIELDVRTTADDVAIIMHDASLKRTTGLDEKVSKVSLAELKKLSAGAWYSDQYKDQEVPTLEAVATQIAQANRNRSHPVKLYVDCKQINTGEVIRILNKTRVLDDAVFYGDISTLKEIKRFYDRARVMPAFPGADKVAHVVSKLHPYAFDVAFTSLNAETVSLCHSNGIKVFSDLLDENDTEEAYRHAIQLGIDLIQTDHVDAVLKVYEEFRLESR